MALENMVGMLGKAQEGRYAVGQFNINNVEWVGAILDKAEELRTPVILGVSEGAWGERGAGALTCGVIHAVFNFCGNVAFETGNATFSSVWCAEEIILTAAVGVACALFALCLVWENVVFSGVKIEVYEHGKGMCALVRTPSACVLVIDDDVSLSVCEDVLMRRFGGALDAVAVVGEDAARGVNTAAFLPARAVYVRESAPWGLEAGLVRGGVRFLVEDLAFRYEGDALVLSAEGVLVKFDFSDARTFGADLYIKAGDGGLQYRAEHGIIKRI